MSPKTTLLLVAIAAFAVGVAVDRIIVTTSTTSSGCAEGEPGRGTGRDGADLRSTGGAQPGMAGSAKSNRDVKRGRSRGGSEEGRDGADSERGEGDVPASVRETLERIEEGTRIDVAMARSLLEATPSGRHRHGIIEHLASHWGRQDPEAAAAWVDELSGRDQRVALEALLHGWSENDPAAAANYAATLPASEHSLHLVRAMAHRWAAEDQGAAMNWALAQTNPATRQRAIGGVVEFWAHGDPAAAANFATSIESAHERYEVLEVAMRNWASQDSAEAMEWANGLGADDRRRANHAILREIAERDPRRAAAIYEEMTAGVGAGGLQGHAQREMAHEIAAIWSSSSPQEAAAWAVDLPEGAEVRRHAVGAVAEHWLRLDSVAAGEWILQLPEGDVRDSASEQVVSSMVNSDPQTAFDWAASLSDEDHRAGLMREVLSRWSATDPGAAQAALGEVDLTPERRRELGELFGESPEPASPDPGAAEEPGSN